MNKRQPTVFHITHPKAGSQWVYSVLAACDPNRIVAPKVGGSQFYSEPILSKKIYPALYITRAEFENTFSVNILKALSKYRSTDLNVVFRNWATFNLGRHPVRCFVVIRDLRDTLVSLYFSLKISHAVISEYVAEKHYKLNEIQSEEEGFLYLFSDYTPIIAGIQSSWLEGHAAGKVLLVRYENLITDEQAEFSKIIQYCQIDITSKRLTEIVNYNSFNKVSGRKPGDEDVASHFRKGIMGDWKNHFTEKVKVEFKDRYGQLLIDTGYEKDFNW